MTIAGRSVEMQLTGSNESLKSQFVKTNKQLTTIEKEATARGISTSQKLQSFKNETQKQFNAITVITQGPKNRLYIWNKSM